MNRLFYLLLLLGIGCTSKPDHFLGFYIGQPIDKWQEHAQFLLETGELKSAQLPLTETRYSLIWPVGNKSYQSLILLNEDSKRYGRLRTIDMLVGVDPIDAQIYGVSDSLLQVRAIDCQLVRRKFENRFGKPDSTVTHYDPITKVLLADKWKPKKEWIVGDQTFWTRDDLKLTITIDSGSASGWKILHIRYSAADYQKMLEEDTDNYLKKL